MAEGKAGDDPVIVRALDSPFEQSEVPLRVTDFAFDEMKALEALKAQVRGEIASTLAISIDVKLVEPKTIQRSEGKAKRVVDKRKL